jgi:uncharacterized protein (DUF1501 family)
MMNRRVFLKNGSLALVSLGFAPTFVARAAEAAQTRKKILIAVFQRGAVDGLNMIVPFGEKAYYDNRPTIAVPRPNERDGAIDLDGFFGLHPRMASLEPFFKRGELAIVHASGSHDETRSHFDAPLAPQLPRTLQGTAPALAIGTLAQFGVRAGAATEMLSNSFEAQYAQAADTLLAPTGKDAFDAVKMMKLADPAQYSPANNADYPRTGFGEAMKQIAQIVKSDLGLEVAFAELGNWDHHLNEGSTQGQIAQRLDDFARGISAFASDLGDRMADVVLITMSEFGRTVKENGNRGTDHGHGNAMLILGGPVKGGQVYGNWPGLAPDKLWQGRDLAITTDFRDVFAEAVTGHLSAKDISRVFPGYRYKDRLGFLRA